ncbi:MAG: hypothetical protein JOZ69_08960, partial [Myxococcales bacterium]|nr:hypothetical protein [Myxococcales bacterium]
LVGIIKDLDLVRRWDESRPPMLRLKAAVFRGPQSASDPVRAMVGVLDKRLSVWTDKETSSISMKVEWPTPQMALEIVNAAYKRFLDARYKSEVSVYNERLRILEMRAQFSAQDVDAAIADLTKLEQDRRGAALASAANMPSGGGAPRPGPRPAAAAPAGPAPSDDVTHSLEVIRGQIRTREDEWHRRIADVESQLADTEASLGPLHPTVLALKRKAEVVHETPPELESLRQNERQLVSSLANMSAAPVPPPEGASGTTAPPAGAPPAPAPVAPPSGGPPSPVNTLLDALGPRDDPTTAYARSKLQAVSQQYNDVLNRMQLAKVELDEAQRSFRETYSINQPAELPAKPKKPNIIVIILAGLVGGVLLAFLVPGARDLFRGRVLEPWQVEALLKMPILGQLPASTETAREPAPDPTVVS